jgi:hypothetical protein
MKISIHELNWTQYVGVWKQTFNSKNEVVSVKLVGFARADAKIPKGYETSTLSLKLLGGTIELLNIKQL